MMHRYDFPREERDLTAAGWTLLIAIALTVTAAAWIFLGAADWSLW
jgi:hypothetical protein